jgi:heavy-metal resistance protein
VPAEPGRRKQFATISSYPETVWKRLRATMLAWFPQIHSKERHVFETHGKRLTAALFAAGLLGAASSWAQAPGGNAPEGMGPMRGLERLHKQLNLNSQQEELWKKAQAAQRDAFRSMRAKGEETRAKLRVEIDKPGADLKQFAQLRDQLGAQMHAQMEATHKQVREAWFAVYDTLDSGQKEKVRVAIRDGMDRMGHMGRHRGGPRGEQHG